MCNSFEEKKKKKRHRALRVDNRKCLTPREQWLFYKQANRRGGERKRGEREKRNEKEKEKEKRKSNTKKLLNKSIKW